MRFTKKFLAVMLTAVMVLGLFTGVRVKAEETAETGIPKISLKYVNNKTGVKITIGKTEGADAYGIKIKGYGASYANYWADYPKDYWRQVGLLEKNGSEKRTYTIKGLPKGTYKIKIATLQKVVFEDGYVEYHDIKYSAEKTVKIKAATAVKTKEKTYDFSKVKVGDIITFGSYEQDGIMTNGKEDIEWIVLEKTTSQILVVSKYALDCLSYHFDRSDITWENCTLRKWLNSSFYKTAFTKAERSLIKKTKLENADNPYYGTEGGNDTKDNIFLLSIDDIVNTKYGFNSDRYEYDIARRCAPTAYAVAQGVWFISRKNYQTAEGGYTCDWWLRSPGYDGDSAAYVDESGRADHNDNDECFAVRPALVIHLQS